MINITEQYANNACRYFCQERNKEFINSMVDFYNAGKKNPAVAKFNLLTSVKDTVDSFRRMSSDAIDITKEDKNMYMKQSILFGDQLETYYRTTMGKINLAKEIIDHVLEKTMGLIDLLQGKNAEVNNLPEKAAFDKKYNELYPRTGKVRDVLIKNLEKDKIKKSSWFLKIQTKSKAEYKELYPKTIEARIALIMDGRIIEESVTPKLNNIFKKFKYLKKLANNNFILKTVFPRMSK